MQCVGCKVEGIETHYGCLCDACGGIVVPGPKGPKLIYRHVATVKRVAPKHLFLIMFDDSTKDYCVSHPAPAPKVVKCVHCGEETPADPAADRARDRSAAELGMVGRPRFLTKHGPLDAVIAYAQPLARGEGGEAPELAPSFHTTEEERGIILQ